jgi:uncharacterized caspase-like protein
VIGESNYHGETLPTASNDARLVSSTLAADGFDVTELHDLDTNALAQDYSAFLNKVRGVPAGAQVAIYLAGLGVTVGCDNYLLPIDAQIHALVDVPRIALSMSRVMADLAQTGANERLLLLDGARPVPASVSSVSFARDLTSCCHSNRTSS